MEKQLKRLGAIVDCYQMIYHRGLISPSTSGGYREVSLKFTTLRTRVKLKTGQDLNIRTFQRDIHTLRDSFNISIVGSDKRDNIYNLVLNPEGIYTMERGCLAFYF